jgi:CheY-like chemotaxis protein
MQILIVDDESSTREALRTVLTQLGHKPILEAKNGEEALKVLETEKTKIRMIIADWEMPYMDGITFSDRLAERENLDSIPFLLITSDLPANRMKEIKQEHPRIDHAIFKPFRLKMIDEAIKTTFANRISKRDALLWLGSASPSLGLVDAVSTKQGETHFRQVITDSDSRNFSAVLLDIDGADLDVSAVNSLKKTPLGSTAIWIGLSRGPQRIAPFRSICHQFIDSNSLKTDDGWSKLLVALDRRLQHGWEIELLSLEVKSLIQQKKADLAKKSLERLLALDPVNAESHAWLADILIQGGDAPQAIHHEFEALRLNPCLAKPYIKLFEILPKTEGTKIAEVAAAARNFCPQSQDVLSAAIAALESSGQGGEASRLKELVLKLAGEKK